MDVKLLLCKLLMTQRISKKTKHKKTAFKLLSLYSITLFAAMNAIPLKTSFVNRFAKASFHLRKAYPVLQSLVNRNWGLFNWDICFGRSTYLTSIAVTKPQTRYSPAGQSSASKTHAVNHIRHAVIEPWTVGRRMLCSRCLCATVRFNCSRTSRNRLLIIGFLKPWNELKIGKEVEELSITVRWQVSLWNVMAFPDTKGFYWYAHNNDLMLRWAFCATIVYIYKWSTLFHLIIVYELMEKIDKSIKMLRTIVNILIVSITSLISLN